MKEGRRSIVASPILVTGDLEMRRRLRDSEHEHACRGE